ncbi:MAG TPA: DUF5777 family beta-barrel protein [Flavitalea sp.]|nr:DUF5777 family beta-barrel protein [Flavitalea sp.]
MKSLNITLKRSLECLVMIMLFLIFEVPAYSQDSTEATEAPAEKKVKPVKNTFDGVWIIDNQTVMVPIKGTFEFDIQHRFGVWENGYDDFWGLFASSNIRFAANYSPIDRLFVGLGLTKNKMLWDFNAKYSIIEQMSEGRWPISVTYYGNAAVDTRSGDFFVHRTDRYSYYNSLIFARKFNEKFSAQVAPNISHTNVVNGYYSEPGKVSPERKHNHFAIALSGRYKIKESMAIIANYDQPLTKHKSGNPSPNISLGIDVTTSAHSFQFFFGNYYFLSPQQNNMYNQNDFTEGQFLLGFNITRLWNY